MYHLKWKSEVIEEDIENKETAEYLQGEYNLAYHGEVTIHKGGS